MKLTELTELYNEVIEFKNLGINFEIEINDFGNDAKFKWKPKKYTVSSLEQLNKLHDKLRSAPSMDDSTNGKITISGMGKQNCVMDVERLVKNFSQGNAFRADHPTLKFFSEIPKHQVFGYDIKYICEQPYEAVENGITYRTIFDSFFNHACVPHTDVLYNYLDKGFFFVSLREHPGRTSYRSMDSEYSGPGIIVANELTLDVILIFCLVLNYPKFTAHLQNECFINAGTAKVIRIKLEKELQTQANNSGMRYVYNSYEHVRNALLKEYEKTANSNILQRVIEDKLPHATYNGIKLTKHKVQYEHITLEATDLIKMLQNIAIFDERTDIYSVVADYTRYIHQAVENAALREDGNPSIEFEFKINDIPIKLKREYSNSRRTINGKHINIAELMEVMNQATCYSDAAEYNKFIKAVSNMSLKLHKAVANGVPVKIVSTMNYEDYRKSQAPACAPKIKFKKDNNKYKLVISDTETVPIKLNNCVNKLNKINAKVDNRWGRRTGHRNYAWGLEQVIQALVASCTFEEEEARDFEERQVVSIDGKSEEVIRTVKKKVKTEKCYLTKEKAQFICKEAEAFQKRALERSKIFLETAVKATGALRTTLDGESGYLVEGRTTKYFVNEKTNTVHNYETKGYICIVEKGHKIESGYDALAARLYALKNDSMMAQKISTLKNAQPA